jgi:hypothetical protein
MGVGIKVSGPNMVNNFTFTLNSQMDTAQATTLGGSIILDNVVFSEITTANIQEPSGTVLAANVSPVRQWFQGNSYSGA